MSKEHPEKLQSNNVGREEFQEILLNKIKNIGQTGDSGNVKEFLLPQHPIAQALGIMAYSGHDFSIDFDFKKKDISYKGLIDLLNSTLRGTQVDLREDTGWISGCYDIVDKTDNKRLGAVVITLDPEEKNVHISFWYGIVAQKSFEKNC
ncbi:hypothetical protein C4572_04420 [Candidatus Parcubacteria bacterium]|nr:MAG: hypothetical protein C4572_04420 [Candidatus Parcubacteria bacterium]